MTRIRDKRLSTRHWQNLRKRVLSRDHHRCQWRLVGCTEFGDQADHIFPRVLMGENDPRFWDEDNLCASCAHCNNRRQFLGPPPYPEAMPGSLGASLSAETYSLGATPTRNRLVTPLSTHRVAAGSVGARRGRRSAFFSSGAHTKRWIQPAFLYKVGIIKKHCSSICCNEQVTISQNKIII